MNAVNNVTLSIIMGSKLMDTIMHMTLSTNNSPGKLVTKTVIVSIILLISTSVSAQAKRYITDAFEVTMRSGTSTANSIVRILKSGEAVIILEEDLASQYSLVELDDGTKGYVLSRYLDEIPSARDRLELLQQKSTRQNQSISALNTEIAQLKSDLNSQQTDNAVLKSTLLASENELEEVRTAAENTLDILDENEQLDAIIETLRKEKQMLSDENDSLKDSTRIDWFFRGAAAFLIAFLLGIIVTRIRWRKKDSWGSY